MNNTFKSVLAAARKAPAKQAIFSDSTLWNIVSTLLRKGYNDREIAAFLNKRNVSVSRTRIATLRTAHGIRRRGKATKPTKGTIKFVKADHAATNEERVAKAVAGN